LKKELQYDGVYVHTRMNEISYSKKGERARESEKTRDRAIKRNSGEKERDSAKERKRDREREKGSQQKREREKARDTKNRERESEREWRDLPGKVVLFDRTEENERDREQSARKRERRASEKREGARSETDIEPGIENKPTHPDNLA